MVFLTFFLFLEEQAIGAYTAEHRTYVVISNYTNSPEWNFIVIPMDMLLFE